MTAPIRRVAFVPLAPLAIPELGRGATGADLVAAIAAATAFLAEDAAAIGVLADVGGSGSPYLADEAATWDFHGFGVPRRVAPRAGLPWQLGIGARHLDDAGWAGPRRYVGLRGSADVAVPSLDQVDALLVVGDGSARRLSTGPAYVDERAPAYDDQCIEALASGAPESLLALDSAVAVELLVAGIAPWRLTGHLLAGTGWDARVLHTEIPYGVSYAVATWQRQPASRG